jgi:hypothetical protein
LLSPPEDLAEDALVAALSREWGVSVAAIAYRPLGFGSHHWAVIDRAGTEWFATVDDLDRKRLSAQDSCDELEAALEGARVADCGPYARQAADLFVTHAAAIRELLARYDVLTAGVDPHRAVLTHGEPHPGNTMRTADAGGWSTGTPR